VKRKSTYLTSLSLIALRTSLAVFMSLAFLVCWLKWKTSGGTAALDQR
jgi:hypothetical protein